MVPKWVAHIVDEARLGVQRGGEHEGVVRVSVPWACVGRALCRMLLHHDSPSHDPFEARHFCCNPFEAFIVLAHEFCTTVNPLTGPSAACEEPMAADKIC